MVNKARQIVFTQGKRVIGRLPPASAALGLDNRPSLGMI